MPKNRFFDLCPIFWLRPIDFLFWAISQSPYIKHLHPYCLTLVQATSKIIYTLIMPSTLKLFHPLLNFIYTSIVSPYRVPLFIEIIYTLIVPFFILSRASTLLKFVFPLVVYSPSRAYARRGERFDRCPAGDLV